MIPFVDLRRQYQALRPEIDAAIARVVEKGAFILGDEVDGFEEEFAAFQRTAHCVGAANGTAALHLALLVAGVGPGDEVITVANTFVATVEPIVQLGARAVFVDVDPLSLTMDPARVRDAITSRTRAIVPVHLYGQMADLDPLLDLAERHGLVMIEDAAQAHGAEYKGRRAGERATLACFSFFPSKNLGAFGDAGALVTNDETLAKKARSLANHGRVAKYESALAGYNYRLDALQAAVLRVKLRRLEQWNEARRAHAALYDELLAATATAPVRAMDYARHVYHLYVVQCAQRDALRAHLRARGIETGVHYPTAVHAQEPFRAGAPRLPVTDLATARILSLPMFPELRKDEIVAVVDAIADFERR